MALRISLAPATKDDVGFIVGIEAAPQNAGLIHRWLEEKHLESLDREDLRYLIACDGDGERIGYAIFAGLTDRANSVELLRIALARPGRGLGWAFLDRILERAFEGFGANRLWLDVYEDNERARRAYLKAGFREEGLLRQAGRKETGELGSFVVMSMLASEYRGLHGT